MANQTLRVALVQENLHAPVTQDGIRVTVQEERIVLRNLERGLPGPPGPAGNLIELIAGEEIVGHRVVTVDGDGRAIHADATNPAHADRILGITTGAANQGQTVILQTHGDLEDPAWTWDPSQPVYLGHDGQLTQTPATSGFNCVIAFPITATRLVIHIHPSIMLFA